VNGRLKMLDFVRRPSRRSARGWRSLICCLAASGFAGMAQAQPAGPAASETPLPQQNTGGTTGPSFWGQTNLLGDPWHAHDWLERYGLSPTLTLATETLRNTSGGYELSTHLQAEAVITLGLDTKKAFGWNGGQFFVSGLAIAGSGISIDGVGSLTSISSIEAERSLRLFELWYDQTFLHGTVSIRLGQLAADQEFLLTSTGSVFLNADFGWPTLPAIDLPGGGPSYPLATPGVRLKISPANGVALLFGIYNGNAAPDAFSDPQLGNSSGTNFRLNGGLFGIAEAQWTGSLHAFGLALPGTYKVGGWWNGNTFLDQHRDANGLSLADINSTGFPALRRNDWSGYVSADQMLWRRADQSVGGLSAFLRVMGAPDDRNEVSVEIDGGFAWRGLFPSRPDDTFGIGFGWFKISQAARALDREIAALGIRRPVRSAEGMIEGTYQASLTPWLQVQPDVQYIVRPGGGVPGGDGADSLRSPLKNSVIVALRTTITF
jgi:porin